MPVHRMIMRGPLFAVLASWASFTVFLATWYYYAYWQFENPDMPIYPGAEQVQRTTNSHYHLPGGSTITIDFVTQAAPSDVELFYSAELGKRAWNWEKACTRFIHRGNGMPYYAFVNARVNGDCITRVDITIIHERMSCDVGTLPAFQSMNVASIATTGP